MLGDGPEGQVLGLPAIAEQVQLLRRPGLLWGPNLLGDGPKGRVLGLLAIAEQVQLLQNIHIAERVQILRNSFSAVETTKEPLGSFVVNESGTAPKIHDLSSKCSI
ncbi:MAG: hypothetical protein CFE39_15300 [Comamonadaceae bacterium PBBC2]|nr:MAG: hypothetical protein CFE39_15300 [Comamonadaceae bacterium PBBC2]